MTGTSEFVVGAVEYGVIRTRRGDQKYFEENLTDL
jgi:hypothetical protein